LGIINTSVFLGRLAGGPNSQEGRLEVRYSGRWGTVCDDSFNTVVFNADFISSARVMSSVNSLVQLAVHV